MKCRCGSSNFEKAGEVKGKEHVHKFYKCATCGHLKSSVRAIRIINRAGRQAGLKV